MTKELIDKTGATVTVELETGSPISSFTVSVDGTRAGRADFIDPAGTETERIFFHTEVADEFGGRGLAGLLVRAALEDSIPKHITVVPVCPVFARHLKTHGDEFLSEGGTFRKTTPDDIAVVTRAVRSRE